MSPRIVLWMLGISASLVLGSNESFGAVPANKTAKTANAKTPTAKKQPAKAPAKDNKPRRVPGTGLAIGQNKATPIERIRAPKDFRVELLYSVPADQYGSWVNLCLDNKGRIIAADQFGALVRFAAPAAGKPLDPAAIEKVPAEIRAVNGMVWAFGALYAVVNDYEAKMQSGLYRVSDSNGDDRLDKVELLRPMQARGDHGVHAIMVTPDGKSLYWITGNGTKMTDYTSSRVPRDWGEDHLLPRMPDGRGFMRDVLGPGGVVYKISPDGRECEVVCVGFRNIFDGALNHEGELFTYDADMEYDFNTSWYRPTRICHVTSGGEYGWRNGAGKRPAWYPDNLPASVDIGPGSPTGMTFGYGARFPAKYQEALYALDWSWGKIYAVHLRPDGSSYTGTREEFISGAPLPVTDMIVNPADGAMYFAIGGRRVQSGLYRVTYAGKEATAAVKPNTIAGSAERALRKRLESFHGRVDPTAVNEAWPYLSHEDRFIRWAARTAIEHQPPQTWADRALAETNSSAQLEALLGLARAAFIDPQHRKPGDPPNDRPLEAKILAALVKLDWNKLSYDDRLRLVRTYEICFNRAGRPDAAEAAKIVAQLDPHFPAKSFPLNWLLCETLVYLQAPGTAAKGIALLERAPSQEQQIEYARSLRMLREGWTLPLRRSYFGWFFKAANYRGGASFDKFLEFIRTEALATLTEAEGKSLADLLDKVPQRKTPAENMAQMFKGRKPNDWKLDDLAAMAQAGLKHRDFENGRKMFGAALCFTCHRFDNQGGMTGPDLSGAGGRYSSRDFLDQIVNPSKTINEQFVPTVIVTEDDEVITGMIVNLSGDSIMICTDPADPWKQQGVDRKKVVSMEPSKVSPMPTNLLALLTKDEILDLVAYVLSGGRPEHAMFAK